MFRAALLLVAAFALWPPAARADVWMAVRVSASETEWDVWTTEPFLGERTLYLWGLLWGGTCELDFSFATPFEVVGLKMRPGFENRGSAESPLITPDTVLSYGLYLIGELDVRDAVGTGGRVCFEPSPDTQRACVLECGVGEWYQPDFIGFRTTGLQYCPQPTTSCFPISVEAESWGRIKAPYRTAN
ncbi:MAG: hypothetical protein DHS20C21_03460 [Gemmatimonadota bacterium]|nr:MAG: hypothetical protein DHS20C21_03460 [Gemmatimonadota bacterium]